MGSLSSAHVSKQSATSLALTLDKISQLLALLQPGNSSPLSNFVDTVNYFSSSSTYSIAWIIDIRASDHMISDMSFIHISTPCAQPQPITLPKNSQVFAAHIGTVSLFPVYIIINVLFVPNFHFNLLSISKLTQQLSCVAIFSTDYCHLQDL